MLGFFNRNSEQYQKNAIGLARVDAIYFPSITLLIGLSTLMTIMIGGLYYIHGNRSIGIDRIIEFVIYINMLTFPVSAIGLTASMIQRAAASTARRADAGAGLHAGAGGNADLSQSHRLQRVVPVELARCVQRAGGALLLRHDLRLVELAAAVERAAAAEPDARGEELSGCRG